MLLEDSRRQSLWVSLRTSAVPRNGLVGRGNKKNGLIEHRHKDSLFHHNLLLDILEDKWQTGARCYEGDEEEYVCGEEKLNYEGW